MQEFIEQVSFFWWGVGVGIIVCATLLLNMLLQQISKKLSKTTPQKILWRRTLLTAFLTPIKCLVWFLSIISSLYLTLSCWNLSFKPELLHPILGIGITLTLAWILLRWKDRYIILIQKSLTSKETQSHIDPTTLIALGKLATVLIVILTTLNVMDLLGMPWHTLLALGGGGAISVGIAGQDIAANFFGGLMIFLNRPFTIGDWINSPDKSIEGTVQEIGWYMTKIISFDKRPIYVPNSLFTKVIVINPSRMLNRRILTDVGVRYEDIKKIPTIVNDIKMMLREHPEIDQTRITLVDFVRFSASSLDINIYTFTKTTDWKRWREIQQEIFLLIGGIVEKNEAEIAFPTSTLHIENAYPTNVQSETMR